jgi:cytochrome P450
MAGILFLLPERVPTPGNLRFERAARRLDQIIFRIIEQRRGSATARGEPSPGSDETLLAMLLRAQDGDGSGMTDQQLRDEVMTLILAGHETTAIALTWTWYLLSQHPEVEARLHAELARALGGRPPTVADLPHLTYAQQVITEAMRLYPPAWAISRQAKEDLALGGHRLPAGTIVVMSQWVMHRHPRFYDEPEVFRPERWEHGTAQQLPRFAYFPFGGGPRLCIGQAFAMMEATLLLATIAQHYAFRLVPGHPVTPWPVVTLRPRYGMRMTLHRRASHDGGDAPERTGAASLDYSRPVRELPLPLGEG